MAATPNPVVIAPKKDHYWQIVETVALLALGYYVYKKVTGGAGTIVQSVSNATQSAGSAIADVIGDITGQNVMTIASNNFRVIAGGVYNIAVNSNGQVTSVRAFNWSNNAYQDFPGMMPPAGWQNAPYPLANFATLRAQGKPWYSPWDSSGLGFNAAFTQGSPSTSSSWWSSLFN